jgi:hypothetical protein
LEKDLKGHTILKKQVKATLGHELAHILYADNIVSRFIVDMVKSSDCSDYHLELCRAQEIRADIVGTFGDKRLMQTGADFFEYEGNDYDIELSHPKNSERRRYLNEMASKTF